MPHKIHYLLITLFWIGGPVGLAWHSYETGFLDFDLWLIFGLHAWINVRVARFLHGKPTDKERQLSLTALWFSPLALMLYLMQLRSKNEFNEE